MRPGGGFSERETQVKAHSEIKKSVMECLTVLAVANTLLCIDGPRPLSSWGIQQKHNRLIGGNEKISSPTVLPFQ